MRKKILIKLIFVLVTLGIGFCNAKQQQETISLKESIAVLNKKNKDLADKEEELHQKNERLEKQAEDSSESLKKIQRQCINSGVDVDLNTDFINIVTKLFEANLNFTPENYENRKREVSGYLSDELKKEYFGQNRDTYQDANETTSKLESLEIYSQEVKNNELLGVTIVYHRNKQINKEWINGMNIFKIKYNIQTNKFTEIINLGNGYSGNMTS